MKIASLLPSATEIVCQLGLEDSLVAISHECDFPASVRRLPRITISKIDPAQPSEKIDAFVRELVNAGESLYAVDAEKLVIAEPDLILTQGLCDVCALTPYDVHEAAVGLRRPPRIVELNPVSLTDVINCFHVIGEATNSIAEATCAIETLNARVKQVARMQAEQPSMPAVLMLEWLDPPFSAGHWNPELIQLAGGKALCSENGAKSRQLEWRAIEASEAQVVLVACCGRTVEQTIGEIDELVIRLRKSDLRAWRNTQIWIADGSMYFNRAGPRLVDSLEIMAQVLHPHLFPGIEERESSEIVRWKF